MKLLAFEGAIALKDCCAKPANAVRMATMDDISSWLDERGCFISYRIILDEDLDALDD